MNISVFIKRTTFHKGFGGLETQNKVLCEGLVARGHDVNVFSPKHELSMTEATENGVSYYFVDCVFRMGYPFLPKRFQETWTLKSYEAFLKFHTEKPFDIVLCQSSAGLGLIRAKNEHNLPIISISHGSVWGEFRSRIKSLPGLSAFLSPKFTYKFIRDFGFVLVNFFGRQREFIHGSTKIVAVSSAVKKQLEDETFAPPEKFEIIHNGINPDQLLASVLESVSKEEAFESSPTKLLYAGRIDRSKGLFLLLESLKNIEEDTWFLDIVGDGPDLPDLKHTASSLGLSNKIKFHGNVPHAQVIALMQNTEIFLLPSLRVEGFPMVLVEAMFSGLAIICADIGGNSDAVENNKTGYLVKSGDPAELTQKIKSLLSDKTLVKEFSTNAKIKAQQNFTTKIMIDKYAKLIESLIHENS